MMQVMTHRWTDDLLQLKNENYDNCTECGVEFKKGEVAHLGFNQNDEPIQACDKCTSNLKETADRHSYSPRPYKAPGKESCLWRYMDFAKYVSLLSSNSMYFARADKLGDPFEGAKGLHSKKEKWNEPYLSFFRHTERNPSPPVKTAYSDDEIEENAQRRLAKREHRGKQARKTTFINCWHENDSESEAMWKLYSNFLDYAVAVKTTYLNLYESMGKKPHIYIGRVKYLDYKKDYAGVHEAFWRKRKSFEYEREVRAIVYDPECSEIGKYIDCNLEILLKRIYVSHTSPKWFHELVIETTKKYGINAPVKYSEIKESPFF